MELDHKLEIDSRAAEQRAIAKIEQMLARPDQLEKVGNLLDIVLVVALVERVPGYLHPCINQRSEVVFARVVCFYYRHIA